MRRIQIGLAAVGMLTLGVGSAHAAGQNAGLRNYAEGVYSEYAAGAGDEISFDVKTLAAGSLKQIADVPFGELIATPGYMIAADELGTGIHDPRFVPSYATNGYDVFMATELKNTPMGFETVAGRSVQAGTYRKLEVFATIDSETRQHEALEFCWPSLGQCTVFDPTVIFMESVVKNQRAAFLAQAKGPQVAAEVAQAPSGEMGTTATCGLASNPAYIGKSLTWKAYTIEYTNVFGGVLVRKNLGGQQAGVRCDSSCKPAPFGYSNVSSCQGFLGWSCSCDNDFGYGATGSTGKWIAETKCAHKYAFSASASASVSNFGSSSVSISWNIDGTTDGNGGYYSDTCGYF